MKIAFRFFSPDVMFKTLEIWSERKWRRLQKPSENEVFLFLPRRFFLHIFNCDYELLLSQTCLRVQTKKPLISTPQDWQITLIGPLFPHRCWSYIGRVYWRKEGQELSLGERCNSKRIVMHELMHAIGFWHEQSRPDRDEHVEILWENIRDGE